VPLYESLRPLAKLWYAYNLGRGRDVPKPRDAPATRSPEPGADRVLLLGNGPCHGWGVDGVRAAGVVRATAEERAPEWTWPGAPRLLELAATGGSPEIRRIADEATKRFKVQVAVVSLLEGDRLYYTNNTESLPMSIPRELSYCYVTFDEESPVIVPDARRDPRFNDNPLIDLSHLIFYAGHPLLSSSGETIGTFCLLGALPRSASAIDMDALGELAQQAQAELWKMEPVRTPS
jgi:GAF domain-containing protein